jgi:hypothetical protein
VVTQQQVEVTTLTAREEQVLRMRSGLSVPRNVPLPSVAGDNQELADELLLLELQLLRAVKARAAAVRARPTATRSPAKDKIVRALKKKKP